MPLAQLIAIGRVAPVPRWKMAAHVHPHHELIVVLRGCLRLRMADTACEARTGELLLYHAGRMHEESSADPREPLESYFLAFEAPTPEMADLPVKLTDRAGRVRQMAHWLFADRHALAETARAMTGALFASLLAELARLHAQPEGGAELVEATRAYIRRHLCEPLTLAVLARQAGLSKFHFSRLYRRLAQRSPMAEVRELRLGHARDLLFTTDLPLKEIAPQAGLADEYRLSHLMRRCHGISPGALRRKARGRG